MNKLTLSDKKQFIINKTNILSVEHKKILLSIFQQGTSDENIIGDSSQGVFVDLKKVDEYLINQAYSFIEKTIQDNLNKLKD